MHGNSNINCKNYFKKLKSVSVLQDYFEINDTFSVIKI